MQPKHAPSDKVPHIPIGYCVHAMWFQSIMLLIRIRPSIAWYHVRQCVRWNLNLDILLPVCDSSWNVCHWQRLSQLMPNPKGNVPCVIDSIGDQPIRCQHRTWRISSYRIRVWRCNAYPLKPISRVASGLISSANVIIPSVTSCLGRDNSPWLGSTLFTLIIWDDKPQVPLTRILTIDCCVCVSK